ncbi:hypothetical protein [Mycoplasma sp. 'Moose RK']|uniref:hypothetical protein n=1 Tax=Mycoplasma sp. 'Moose RK' TaxID=2780095 RepID=UPI001E64B79A|nr:hypothetical protein [Mycoplasma sp. 'Moose RK']
MKTIYKVVNYLIHENIIEAQIISNKLIITTVLDLKKYYIPKRILELSSLSRTLVSANYLRIYQYLKNLAISNFKSSKNANEIFESENSYAYFQNLKLDKETIIAGLKWIRKNNLLIEFENKTISKEFINHINLDKNKFFKGIKYQKELITIKLKNIEKVLYRQIDQKVVSFYSKVKFIWEVQKTVIKKIKKFFEYFIKKPCYLLRKVKSGWIYSACWCKNNGIHWEINREVPKYKSFYRDKNLIIRRQGQRSFYKLFNKLKHFQNSWFFKFKIMH